MIVGYYAPPSGARSGVADYAEALRRALESHCKLRINGSGDVNLYQIGNNQLHRGIYEQALLNPGVVLLHDAVLHHFFLGWMPRDRYIQEFVYNYGEWRHGLAERLFNHRARSSSDPRYFRYPMLRRICESAKLVVVHNKGAAQMVRAHAAAATVVVIPHLNFSAPLARPRQSFTFGVFGHLRETKRVTTILRAFSELRREIPGATLLLAGEPASTSYERLLDRPVDGVTRVGHTSEAGFWSLAHSVDVCVNLRYPTAGETSGITIRLMEAGKPVIMSAGCETSDFPHDACVRIDPGIGEASMLTDTMRWLAQFPGDARAMGARAQAYVRRYHGPALIAEQFAAVFESARL